MSQLKFADWEEYRQWYIAHGGEDPGPTDPIRNGYPIAILSTMAKMNYNDADPKVLKRLEGDPEKF